MNHELLCSTQIRLWKKADKEESIEEEEDEKARGEMKGGLFDPIYKEKGNR